MWLPLTCPQSGSPTGLQPKHVLWLGIEPATLWFADWHSIHWATPARALNFFFLFFFLIFLFNLVYYFYFVFLIFSKKFFLFLFWSHHVYWPCSHLCQGGVLYWQLHTTEYHRHGVLCWGEDGLAHFDQHRGGCENHEPVELLWSFSRCSLS